MTRDDLAAAGIAVDAAAFARLERFVAALLDENRKLNLTAIRDAANAWRVHVCDSLALLPLIDALAPGTLLDVGTGGGLPGLPVACVRPVLRVTLLDATAKKVAAVERIARGVGLENAACLCGRAEALAHDARWREAFVSVAARAVAPLAELVEYVAGFVRVGGEAWFFKTRARLDVELSAAGAALARCGLRPAGVHEYTLPQESEPRVVLRFVKTGPLPADLPRRTGRAKHRPL